MRPQLGISRVHHPEPGVSCSLRRHIHIKRLKCTSNPRTDLNLNSNHRNVINKDFALK